MCCCHGLLAWSSYRTRFDLESAWAILISLKNHDLNVEGEPTVIPANVETMKNADV